MSEPAPENPEAEQPEAIDESIPSPPPPAAESAPSRPTSPAAAEPAPSPPPPPPTAESPFPRATGSPEPAPHSADPTPRAATPTGPESSTTIIVAQPEPVSPNLPAVPASPNPPPPPAPSRAPSASPALSTPASAVYTEAPPVPSSEVTPLPPPISQPGQLRTVEPISENEEGHTQTTLQIVPNNSEGEPVVVVHGPIRNETEILRPTERASTVKNVAFEPEGVTVEKAERVPTRMVVEDNPARVLPTRRTFQNIPSEVPPVVIVPAEPTGEVNPEAKLARMRFRDRFRHGLHPGYRRSIFRCRFRENPEPHLKPRRRDRLRAKLLSHAALAILIGRRPTTVVKPIVEEAAIAPRGRDHRRWSKWDALKRLLFLKRHDYARKRHAEKAELHEVYRQNAERENFTEAEWRHAERHARHQRKAIYHAEKQIRGRRRYTDEEVRLAATQDPIVGPRQDERVGYAARHLREARRNLEANLDRSQRQMINSERRIRHPVRRLERDVQNLEIEENQVKKEIDELTRIESEHRGRANEGHDQEKVQALLDREEKVKRNLAVARERLRNAKDHVERDEVQRITDTRGEYRAGNEVVVTEAGKLPEQNQVRQTSVGIGLDGSSQSSIKRAKTPAAARAKASRYPDNRPNILHAQATGFKRQQEILGCSPNRTTRARSSSQSMSSLAESQKSGASATNRSLSVRTSSSDSMRIDQTQNISRCSQETPRLAPSATIGPETAAQGRVKTSTSFTYPPPPALEHQPNRRPDISQREAQSNSRDNGSVPRDYYLECPMCGRPFKRPRVAKHLDFVRSDGSNAASHPARTRSKESFSKSSGPTRKTSSMVLAEDVEPLGARSFRIDI